MDWDAKRKQLWDDVEAQLDWMSKHIDDLEAENAQLTEQVAELRDMLESSCKREPSEFWWEMHHPNGESATVMGWKCSRCGHDNPMTSHYCGDCGSVVA